jgi:peptide/nickel transport system ATP-binding protein
MSAENSSIPILELSGVTKKFGQEPGVFTKFLKKLGAAHKNEFVYAVNNISLKVAKNEVVGLVGESGCGKSTLGRLAVGLLSPDTGRRIWRGNDYDAMTAQEQFKVRLSVQMIFQDPYASLNPRMRAVDSVTEAPIYHGLVAEKNKEEFARALFAKVGLSSEMLERYPHQLSGGQRSRLGIARALAVDPEFLVCDEAVAALDVSIQAQILNLFMKLRDESDLSFLFISHDLGVVRHLTDRVVIMYLGRVVEEGVTAEIFSSANHPYTKALLSEMPVIRLERKSFNPVQGEIPSPMNPPTGCHFHPRCPHAFKRCSEEVPQLLRVAPDHYSACHLNDQH